MKKIFYALSVLLAVMFVLASCGGGGGSVEKIVYMGWTGPGEREIMEKLIAKFEKKYPHIKVIYRYIPIGQYLERLQSTIAAGEPPDVFYVPDGDFGGIVARGVLEPLDSYIEDSEVIDLSDMWPQGIWRYRFDGKKRGSGPIYALPKDIGPLVMYYNKDIFDKRGVPYPDPEKPWTWDEAVKNWQKLTFDEDGDGTIDYWGAVGFPLESAIWSNGGRIVDIEKIEFVLHKSPEAIEALQWVADLTWRWHVQPSLAQLRSFGVTGSPVFEGSIFEMGRTACYFSGRWMVPSFRERAVFDWDVAHIPVSPKTRRKAGWSGSVGLAMARVSKHKEAAWKLIEFLAGPEGQTELTKLGFQLPNQISIAKTDVFLQRDKKPAHAEVFIEAALYERPNPSALLPVSQRWWATFLQELDKVWTNQATVEQVVHEVAPQINAILEDEVRKLGIK